MMDGIRALVVLLVMLLPFLGGCKSMGVLGWIWGDD